MVIGARQLTAHRSQTTHHRLGHRGHATSPSANLDLRVLLARDHQGRAVSGYSHGHSARNRDLRIVRRTGDVGATARLEELARAGLAWALPNLLLGALVIVPVWFLLYLFRPPGESRD